MTNDGVSESEVVNFGDVQRFFVYSIRDVHAGDLLAHLENQNVNDLDLEIFVQMALRRTFFGPKVYTPRNRTN